MAIECGIIAAVFAVMAIGFFVKHRNFWAFATLPLTLVPLVEFMLDLVFASVISLSITPYVRVMGLLIAVAISCVWIGFVSVGMKSKSKRFTYIGTTYVYNVLMVAILTYNILSEFA
ncbi:MAG: hypothetical protein ACI4KA_07840 [Oscillospiraceae bacterium]